MGLSHETAAKGRGHTRTLVAYLSEGGAYPPPEMAKTHLSSNSWPSLIGIRWGHSSAFAEVCPLSL